jgi:hypothetical protein
MAKMLLAGCSHSAGFGLDDINKSWGNIFAKNNNHTLINVSQPASSLQYAIQKIVDEISKEDYSTVILQLTTFDRYPITYNGEERFLSNNITDVNTSVADIFHLVPANYLEAVNGNKMPLDNNVIRFFNEKVMFSTFYLNTIMNEIYLLQQVLKQKGIYFILIPYDDYFWGEESNMSIWKFEQSKKIDKSNYIKYPFMKWLRDNYNPDEYYVDKGFHLNEQGHRLFAEEYLPSQIKLLSKLI